MINTDVPRHAGDDFVGKMVAMRDRFHARVLAAPTWAEGMTVALAELADHVAENPVVMRQEVFGARLAGRELLALADLERRRSVSTMRRGWVHHHPGEPVPELHFEFLCGAISHVIANALERDEVDDLPTRLMGLVLLTGEALPTSPSA